MKRYLSFLIFFTVLPLFSRTTVTIFIHGTQGAFIDMLHNPRMVFGSYDAGRSENGFQKAFRDCLFNKECQLIDKKGLVKFEIGANHSDLYDIRYSILDLYDYTARSCEPAAAKREYYLFGWSGRLSQKERRTAGRALYNALKKIREEYLDRGEDVLFRIEAHSHGGTVALYAANAAHHDQYPFQIDRLCTYGMPISKESIGGIISPFFKEIYTISVPNDWIQQGDRFSTPGNHSSASMHDVVCFHKYPSLLRRDILVQCSGSDSSKFSLNHINLWHVDPGQSIAQILYPLPLICIAPAIIALLQKTSCTVDTSPYCIELRDRSPDDARLVVVSDQSASYTLDAYTKSLAKNTQEKWKPRSFITTNPFLNWLGIVGRELRYAIIKG